MPNWLQMACIAVALVSTALSLYFNWDTNRMCKEVERRYQCRR